MKYLFFDIECARCYKMGLGVMCEFGYVLTDDKFNVIGRDTLLVAPQVEFQKYVIENLLAFTKEEYEGAPNFEERYCTIRDLLEDKDTTVIGHSTDTDARYLNYAAKRYELPFINFEFYDIKKIHKHQRKAKNFASLENMIKDLNLEFDGRLHKSEDDACVTMLAFKELCNIANADATAVLSEYLRGSTSDGKVKECKLPFVEVTEEERAERRQKMLENYAVENVVNKSNFFLLLQLNDGVVQDEPIESRLSGKKVFIDRDYEQMHFKEMLSLISLIKRHGGSCCFYPVECDTYVNALQPDSDGKYAYNLKKARRKKAEIITFEQLLDILNVSEDDLRTMPFPSYSAFKRKKKTAAGDN